MARGASKTADTAAKQSTSTFGAASNLAGTSGSNASSLFSTLFPEYENEAMNPQGYDTSDLDAMNTAVGQTAGGSTARAIGEGNLKAARTGNAGGFQASEDEAAREGLRTQADAALTIQGKNADLKQRQQQAGLSGLADLYKSQNQDLLSALGLENQATGATIGASGAQANAGKSGWFQNALGLIQALKPGGSYNNANGAWSIGAG